MKHLHGAAREDTTRCHGGTSFWHVDGHTSFWHVDGHIYFLHFASFHDSLSLTYFLASWGVVLACPLVHLVFWNLPFSLSNFLFGNAGHRFGLSSFWPFFWPWLRRWWRWRWRWWGRGRGRRRWWSMIDDEWWIMYDEWMKGWMDEVMKWWGDEVMNW